MKKPDITIEYGDDLITARYCKTATGKKIVLYIRNKQGVSRSERNFHVNPHDSRAASYRRYQRNA